MVREGPERVLEGSWKGPWRVLEQEGCERVRKGLGRLWEGSRKGRGRVQFGRFLGGSLKRPRVSGKGPGRVQEGCRKGAGRVWEGSRKSQDLEWSEASDLGGSGNGHGRVKE